MLKLIAQRFALGLLTLFAASVLIFAGTEILPGDLASAILQNNATPESLAAMRKELGLERPAYVRYGEWLGGVAHGDLGRSLANNRDVAEEIAPRLKNTLFLALYAAIISMPLAVALGLLAAIRQGGIYDRLVNVDHIDDHLGARIFPRLCAGEISGRGTGVVSLAGQRHAATPASSTG